MALEVEIVGDQLECRVDGKAVWSKPVHSIVLIAEYATNGGYWGDDCFLLFLFSEQGKFIDVSVSDIVIGGHGVLLRALAQHLDTTLDLKLPIAAKFASRAVWPEAVKDEKLFTFDPIAPVGVWEMLKSRCFGGSLSLAMTRPIVEYLRTVEAESTKSGSRIARR